MALLDPLGREVGEAARPSLLAQRRTKLAQQQARELLPEGQCVGVASGRAHTKGRLTFYHKLVELPISKMCGRVAASDSLQGFGKLVMQLRKYSLAFGHLDPPELFGYNTK